MAEKPQEIKINPNTVVGTTYSQLVGVSVTDFDITLEFVFINPRDKSFAQVVSRVTLPRKIGIDLANTILMTAKVHANKKKGERND